MRSVTPLRGVSTSSLCTQKYSLLPRLSLRVPLMDQQPVQERTCYFYNCTLEYWTQYGSLEIQARAKLVHLNQK